MEAGGTRTGHRPEPGRRRKLVVLVMVLLFGHSTSVRAQPPGRSAALSLLDAACLGEPEQVRMLLAKKPNLEQRDAQGRTALLLCVIGSFNELGDVRASGVEKRHAETVDLLLEAGADVNTTDRTGMTPLMRSVGWRQYVVMDRLLNHGARVDRVDKVGRTALTWGARDGATSPGVKALLSRGCPVGVMDAVLMGDRAKASALLDSGAKIMARGPYKETALMAAAEQADESMVKRLLEAKVDVNARDEEGVTALLVAIAGRPTVSVPGGFIEWSENDPEARERILQLLIGAGANPNRGRRYVEEHGIEGQDTPLVRAAYLGRVRMVELLLAAHATVDARASYGETALHRAAGEGRLEVVERLLAAGARIDVQTKEGRTPLMSAASGASLPIVNLLVERGAMLDAKDNEGKTALNVANSEEMILFLLSRGAQICTDKWHQSPLTRALWVGHERAVEALQRAGAKAGLLDAILMNDFVAVRKLFAQGAKASDYGPDKDAVLLKAAERASIEVVEAVLNARLSPKPHNDPLSLALLRAVEGPLIDSVRAKMKLWYGTEQHARTLRVASLLLDRGADVNAHTYSDDTVLMYAASAGNEPLVQHLLIRGATVAQKNDRGETALSLAEKRGYTKIVEMLKEKEAAGKREENFQNGEGGALLRQAAAQRTAAAVRPGGPR